MNLTTIALVLAMNATPAETAAAPEHPACEQCGGGGRSRQLGGHSFLFPLLQQSAFISTYVGVREAVTGYDVPDLPIGRLGTQDVSLVGYQQTLDLGLRFTRWLGLYGEAHGILYSGLTVGSFVSDGAHFEAGGEGGLVVRVLHFDASGTQLSLRAGGGYQKGRELTLLPLLTAIVDSPLETLESILRGNLGELLIVPTTDTSVNGGVYLAQALGGPMLGLQASASVTRAWHTRQPFGTAEETRIDQGSTSTQVNLATALTADFGPLGVPLALMGEYLFTASHKSDVALERKDVIFSSVALGLYYSGRPNLQLGLGGVAVLHAEPRLGRDADGNPARSGEPTLLYGQLILRYIW